MAALLEALPELRYLRTITTRPMRPGEENSHEYEFVTPKEYEQRKSHSSHWDETEYNGFYYGANAEESQHLLAQGVYVVCSVAPSQKILNEMLDVYGPRLVTVWIDTPQHVARERIAADSSRSARQEDDRLKSSFAYTFIPTGNLESDKSAFISMVAGIIA